jgi:HEAT repeat protein
MRRARVAPWGLVATIALGSAASNAQQPRPLPHPLPRPAFDVPAAAPADPSPGLRATLGMDRVLVLLRSTSDDDVARGIERLARLDTPEAFALLVRCASQGGSASADAVTGCGRRSPRTLLGVVRALAPYVDREPARKALFDLLDAPSQQLDASAPAAATDPDAAQLRTAALLLARRQAALALASSGSTRVEEKLVDVARKEGPGESAAVLALAANPPQSAVVLGGVALTTPSMIGLAEAVGDLRTLDAMLGLLKASDPGLRAAALGALGKAGDARVLEDARGAEHDPVAKVRVAAAEALVDLGVADAGAAVEALVADEATALDGLRLAAEVQGEGVTRAAAARAAASSDPALRSAAVEALGAQTSSSAVAALVELGRIPALRGDAADALAHSPSAAALPAIEAMASRPGDARLAGRVYFVRRFVRDARSRALDALLVRLASSPASQDRAVGVEALVAFGEHPLGIALSDADARVRIAAAMGAATRRDPSACASLLGRLAVEPDPAVRTVLALGLACDDDPGTLPTSAIVERLRSGGPDAPLLALALARRSAGSVAPDVTALLASRDPVVRAHVARGLGRAAAPDAAGLLARAYGTEVDSGVRRALVEALASRSQPIGPSGDAALALAARLDPDRETRTVAERALRHDASPRTARVPEVAWVSLVAAEGAALPPGAAAMLVDAEGVGYPVAFDDEGFALEPGVSSGPYHLRLAPRVPSYFPSVP